MSKGETVFGIDLGGTGGILTWLDEIAGEAINNNNRRLISYTSVPVSGQESKTEKKPRHKIRGSEVIR